MISSIISRLVILVFGTLYPAYASYKAVRTKNVKEYVKWMMYWIVFALFTCAETFTDVFFSFWFPFYYEIKIILVLWLLSPATKGSSILYRRFVHPALSRREAEIDDALARATEQGYTAVLHLGTRGVNYATTVLMQTAIKNFPNVVPTNPRNTHPGSQSDTAIFSSAETGTSAAAIPGSDSTDSTIAATASTKAPAKRGRRRKTATRRPRNEAGIADIVEEPGAATEAEEESGPRRIRDRDRHEAIPGRRLDERDEDEDGDESFDGEDSLDDSFDDFEPGSYSLDESPPPAVFKIPAKEPKNLAEAKRRKATLRNYDPEFSDEPADA